MEQVMWVLLRQPVEYSHTPALTRRTGAPCLAARTCTLGPRSAYRSSAAHQPVSHNNIRFSGVPYAAVPAPAVPAPAQA